MNTYLFKKPHIRVINKGYWHDDVISDFFIKADTIKEAIKQYSDHVKDKYYIEISKTSQKRPIKQYHDMSDGTSKHTGYVFYATTEILNDDTHKWVKVRLQVWTTIHVVQDLEAIK